MSTWSVVSGSHRDILGEGLIWSSRRNSILWVDIVGQVLQQFCLRTGVIRSWHLPERAGWVVERTNGGLLIGLKSGIASLSLDPFYVSYLCSPEPDRPQNRLNDAAVDPRGNLWFGTKDDTDRQASGALYRLDSQLHCVRQDDGYRVPNGPVFSRDGHSFWHADSLLGVVYSFDVDHDNRAIRRGEFLRFPEDWGLPDGMTVDLEGCLWIAHWGGGRVSRFAPDGSLKVSIALPTQKITNVVFAGPELNRMFVTSARGDRAEDRYAGALFEVDPGVTGIAPTPFAG